MDVSHTSTDTYKFNSSSSYGSTAQYGGPGPPFWGFVTITFLRGWIVSPGPNPQPGTPGLRIYDPWRQGGPAIPQALGTHFSRLLRHEWVTVGLFFNPGHHMGYKFNSLYFILRLYVPKRASLQQRKIYWMKSANIHKTYFV
jgi:hypothetical protein